MDRAWAVAHLLARSVVRTRTQALLGLAIVAGLTLVPTFAYADTLTVTSTADSGSGSLRESVAQANPGDTVFLPAAASHYLVTSGEIQITKAITIEGAGVNSSVIDAGGNNRVFEVSAATGGSGVRFEDVSITGGSTDSAPGGGGILVDPGAGDLTLLNAAVTGNTVNVAMGAAPAGGGGGVYNAGGNTSLTNSSVSGNHAIVSTAGSCCHGGAGLYGDAGTITITNSAVDGNQLTVNGPAVDNEGDEDACCDGGGGLFQRAAAPTSISGSTFNANSAALNTGDCCQGGGAIAIDHGVNASLTVQSSTLRGNSVTVSSADCCNGGGAIQYNPDTDGSPASVMSVINTLITDNHASFTASALQSGGGGIYDDSDGDRYINSTITGNTSDAAASADAGGGGLVLYGNFLHQAYVFANVTIANNSAPSGLGGGVLGLGNAVGRFKNSIVALNQGSGGADCAPRFGSLGYNLEDSPDTCGFGAAGDRVVASNTLGLGALADNGGPTMTEGLLFGSPAIDSGNPAGCTDPSGLPITVDQRGFPRPSGSRCDIGAFELQQSPFTPSPSGPGGGGSPAGQTSLGAAPRCTVSLASTTIFLALRTSANRHKTGHVRGSLGTVRVSAECDQATDASLFGKLTGRIAGAVRHHSRWVLPLRRVQMRLRANLVSVFVVKLPKAALAGLAHGRHEWIRFTLAAINVNGSTNASTRPMALVGRRGT